MLKGKIGVLIYPNLSKNIEPFQVPEICTEPTVVILNLDLWKLFSKIKDKVEERSSSSNIRVKDLVIELRKQINSKILSVLSN